MRTLIFQSSQCRPPPTKVSLSPNEESQFSGHGGACVSGHVAPATACVRRPTFAGCVVVRSGKRARRDAGCV